MLSSHSKNNDRFFSSLSLSLSLCAGSPVLLTQTRDGSGTVLAADAAACLLLPNYVWLSLIRVGVNDGRDLRVVIDVVLGLITCGSGWVGQGARDQTTERSRASRACWRRHWSRKCHRRWKGQRRRKMDVQMTVLVGETCADVNSFAHATSALGTWTKRTHVCCTKCAKWRWHRTTRKCLCNRWCSLHSQSRTWELPLPARETVGEEKMTRQGTRHRKWLYIAFGLPMRWQSLVQWAPVFILLSRSRFPTCLSSQVLTFMVFPIVVIPIPPGISCPPTVIPRSRRNGAWWWSVVGKIKMPISDNKIGHLSKSGSRASVRCLASFPNNKSCY